MQGQKHIAYQGLLQCLLHLEFGCSNHLDLGKGDDHGIMQNLILTFDRVKSVCQVYRLRKLISEEGPQVFVVRKLLLEYIRDRGKI